MFFFFRQSQLFCGTGHFIPQCLAKFYAKLQGADNLFCFPGLRDMYRKEMQQQLDMHTTQMEKWKDIERWDHLFLIGIGHEIFGWQFLSLNQSLKK